MPSNRKSGRPERAKAGTLIRAETQEREKAALEALLNEHKRETRALLDSFTGLEEQKAPDSIGIHLYP